MKFAVIKTGGKQYKVSTGDVLEVEKLPEAKGGKFTFDEVLLVADDKKTTVGTPNVKDAKVKADLVEEGRGKKVTIIKYKRKTRYRRKIGHRQPFTKIKISAIS